MADLNPFGADAAVGVMASTPAADPSMLTPAPTPAATASPLATADAPASGMRGVVIGAGDMKAPPATAASSSSSSSSGGVSFAADTKGGFDDIAAPVRAHKYSTAEKRATLDSWRRQTEWRAAQGVVTHKVTVSVEVQQKKVMLYKFTFKPQPLPPSTAAAATGGGAAAPATAPAGPDITVFRRYDDVVWLRAAVTKLFPGLWFCNLASKGVFTSVDEKFMSERRDDTERLLNQMCGVGHGHGLVAQCDPFIQFISAVGVDSFDKVRKEVDARIKLRPIEECLKLYSAHFSHYMSTPVPDKADEQVAEWLKFLKQQTETLEKCADVAAALETTNATLISTGVKLSSALEAVGKHEDTTKTRCTPARTETASKFGAWMDASRAQAASYGPALTVNFRRELTDIRAFVDVLTTRNDLVKAAASAKATAAKWKLPPGPKDKPLTDKQKQQKDAELKAEIDTQSLQEAVTKLVLGQQNKLFWHDKVILYSKAMSGLAQAQMKALESLAPAWKKLQDEASVEVVLL